MSFKQPAGRSRITSETELLHQIRSRSQGAEVICIIRSKSQPAADRVLYLNGDELGAARGPRR